MRPISGGLNYEQAINGGRAVEDPHNIPDTNSQSGGRRQRKYLPSLADLIDRLCICLQKLIFIEERRAEYASEIDDIVHDIDLILEEDGHRLHGLEIKAIAVLMLANRFIWENESKTRSGDDTEDPLVQLQRLRATHSINGVRATAKNELSRVTNQRQDYKIDCFANNLPRDFGNWRVFDIMLDQGDGHDQRGTDRV